MKTKKILGLVSSFFVVFNGCTKNQTPKASLQATVPAAVHGMVMFGSDTLFASHIPMYHSPHDYQALFEIELSHPSADAKALYKAQLANNKQMLITLQPEKFVLPDLLDKKIPGFKSKIFVGNFENGGQELLTGVQVTVKNIIFAKQLLTNDSPLSQLTYFVLQDKSKLFLIHKISAPDNFDHIVEAHLNDDTLASSLPNEIQIPNIADSLQNKLKQDNIVPVANSQAKIRVSNSFYCLVGPDFFKNC